MARSFSGFLFQRIRTWADRLLRDIGYKIAGIREAEAAFATTRERLTGVAVERACVDRGYRGHPLRAWQRRGSNRAREGWLRVDC